MNEWATNYKKTAISTLIVIGILIVAFGLVYGFINGSITKFFNDLMEIISPIIIGFVMAYLSNPIVTFLERRIFWWIPKFTPKRLLSIIVTFVVIIIFISFIITMLIPSILSTLQSFWDTYIVNYESSLKALAHKINTLMDDIVFLETVQRIDPDGLVEWIRDKFPWIDQIVEGDFSAIFPTDATNSDNVDSSSNVNIANLLTTENIVYVLGYVLSLGSSVFNVVKNVILGIFIAIYMLMSKEKSKAYLRRLLNGFLSPKKVRAIIRFGELLDRSFGGFIEGQLLDAIVVGIISYIVFVIFKLPIPHLLATIIAVTNVIPVFGPFIGGIPAALLVFLTQPEKVILFIILIVIIQQIDGNLICPHILGDRINISSLATITAIVTMGGLFGIFGMVIGVPVFAVIIHLINNFTMNSLRRKGLETSLNHYYVGSIDRIESKKHSNKRITLIPLKLIFASIKESLSNLIAKDGNNNEKEK